MIDRYFPRTKNALNTTINDFKAIYKTIKYVSLLFTIGYLAYVFIAPVGNFWVNVALASITGIYYLFFVLFAKQSGKVAQSAKKVVRRIYHWLRILVRAASLGILLYGMAIEPQSATPISIILATITIIVWVLQVIFELICNLLEVHKDLIVECAIADWQSADVQKVKEKVLKAKETVVSIKQKVEKAANVWDKIRHPFKKKTEEITETAATEYLLEDEDPQEER